MGETGKILLCSDLDRTIIPNGFQEESFEARPLLRRIAMRPELVLVYVTGRDTGLVAEAVKTWNLPLPDIAVADVGTAIYDVAGTQGDPEFLPWPKWKTAIARDWNDRSPAELAEMLSGFHVMHLQESHKQKDFKLSFYASPDENLAVLAGQIRAHLARHGVRASIITSIDETADTGFVDVLPERATKVHAIYWIMDAAGIPWDRVVYAGDSGNDLPALTSGLNAVIVRNASEEVRREVRRIASRKGIASRLYTAGGDFYGMNGNYSAGVLEGLAHFLPEADAWIQSELEVIRGS